MSTDLIEEILNAIHQLRLADADEKHPLADEREYERRGAAVAAVRTALDNYAPTFGTCDTCGNRYPLGERNVTNAEKIRCGDCGNCSNCCTH